LEKRGAITKQAPIALTLLLGLAGTLGAAQKHPPVDLRAPETSAARLHRELAQGAKLLIIDVRTPKEYAAGHVPEAMNIPLEELRSRIAALHLPKDARIVTMCDRGGRSSRAVRELEKWGYRASSFCRLDSWKTKGYKVKTGEPKPAKTSRARPFSSPGWA
jgi:rhodanese-related sulfurtransferase